MLHNIISKKLKSTILSYKTLSLFKTMFTDYEINYYEEISNKCNAIKQQNLNGEWKSIKIDDIQIDDDIFITYIPNSQKNLYTHTPEIGKVIRIDKTNCVNPNNYNDHSTHFIINDIIIKNADDEEISIYKYGLCYYSNGYDMYIEKLFIKSLKRKTLDDYFTKKPRIIL